MPPHESSPASFRGQMTAAVLLRCVHHAMALVLREPIESRPPIKSWPQLQDYLRVSLSHKRTRWSAFCFWTGETTSLRTSCIPKVRTTTRLFTRAK